MLNKKKSPFFLSIGIPTWNRSVFLKKNILNIIQQIRKYNLLNVEIFVSDNASDDDTKSFCENIAPSCTFFTYHKQFKNLGANENFKTVLEKANGEYIWLLGDDDLLVEKAMVKVLQSLEKNKPDVLIGPAMYDDTLKKGSHLYVKKPICTDHNILKKDNIIDLAGKMSGLIFKKTSITEILSFADQLIKEIRTPWPHLVWFILLLNRPNAKIMLVPYSTNIIVGDHWQNLLLDGKKLMYIHFISQQELLLALKPYIHGHLFHKLIYNTVNGRVNILFKCMVYGTYLNTYMEMVKYAWIFFPSLVGLKNKFFYFIFLMLPLLLPRTIRKWIFSSLSLLSFRKFSILQQTISRLKQARIILKDKKKILRQEFNNTQL